MIVIPSEARRSRGIPVRYLYASRRDPSTSLGYDELATNDPFLQYLLPRSGGVRSARSAQCLDLHLRADCLQPRPHRKFSRLHFRGFVAAASRSARLQRPSSDEHYGRGRQNHSGRAGSERFAERFHRRLSSADFLKISKLCASNAPTNIPAATEPRYLARMIAMISELINRDLAYQAEDKSVYFRINKFPDYGKLAHLNLEELRPTGRVRNDEYEKENIGDFALWKAWDEADGEVGWDSPWGRGRPGWHIECSAMATSLLGDQIDIHCGGVDNIFPHHEAEIAQSEGVTGKKFVRYWMHCAHLLVDNQKMSKSLGNFYTLRDVIAKGYSGREVRYALLRVHYRAQLNFTFEGMEESRQALTRVDEWLQRLRETSASALPGKDAGPVPTDDFQSALDDDLNISGALGVFV